jgi:hypothetical protein
MQLRFSLGGKLKYYLELSTSAGMVETRKMILEVQIEIDVPIDIVEDNHRIVAVEEGIKRTISKGLYDQGVSFEIKKFSSTIR